MKYNKWNHLVYEIGDYIGKFKILDIFYGKRKNRLYRVQCTECGKILFRKSKRDLIKLTKTKKCNHRNKEDMQYKVGDIVKNKYKVIKVCGQNKQGLFCYDFECLDCGFIKTNSEPHSLRKSCNHIGSNCYYKWKNKKLSDVYRGIIKRCYNPNDPAYMHYGGRGIKVCKEWYDPNSTHKADLKRNFEEWALANGYQPGLYINRKNVNGDYCPENCEFVTPEYSNGHDRRNLREITVDGETHNTSEWGKILFKKENVLRNWIYSVNNGYEDMNKIKEFIHNRMVETGFYIATLWVDQTYMSYESWDINCMYPPGTLYRYMLEHGENDTIILIMNRLEELGLKNIVGFTE